MELCIVCAIVVPVMCVRSNSPRQEPPEVVIGSENISVIPPQETPTEASAVNQPQEVRAQTQIAKVGSGARTRLTVPAPPSVRSLADKHGGGRQSRWVPEECENVAALVRRYGLPAWMTTVAWRESRCQRAARNLDRRTADQSYGLFQINVLGDLWKESRDRCGLQRPEELLDAHTNVACAATLYRAYGYQPWDSGRYFQR